MTKKKPLDDDDTDNLGGALSDTPAAPSSPPADAEKPTASSTGANPMNAGSVDGSGQPEDPRKYDAVDPLVDGEPRRWTDVGALIEHIERHAAKSHGLASDVELLKDIATYLRYELGYPHAS